MFNLTNNIHNLHKLKVLTEIEHTLAVQALGQISMEDPCVPPQLVTEIVPGEQMTKPSGVPAPTPAPAPPSASQKGVGQVTPPDQEADILGEDGLLLHSTSFEYHLRDDDLDDL